MPRRRYSCSSRISRDHVVERLVVDARDLVLRERPARLGLLLLLDELLAATLPVGVEDVGAVDGRDRRRRRHGTSAEQAGGFDEQEATNERDARRIQITTLAELRMVWSTRQDSFELLENGRGEKLKKRIGRQGLKSSDGGTSD